MVEPPYWLKGDRPSRAGNPPPAAARLHSPTNSCGVQKQWNELCECVVATKRGQRVNLHFGWGTYAQVDLLVVPDPTLLYPTLVGLHAGGLLYSPPVCSVGL